MKPKRALAILFALLPILVGACADGSSGTDPDGAPPSPDAAGVDGQVADAQVADAAPHDGGQPPDPVPREPCLNGTCWQTRAPALQCAPFGLGEDYSSGNYNVHRYATTIWGGLATDFQIVRTAGTFQPALIIVAEDGTTLFDGETGRVAPGLTVTPQLDGRTGDTARVTVASDATLSVYLFVTGWSVVDSDFVSFLGTDVDYDLSIEPTCPIATSVPCVVNGNTVTEPGCRWIHYLALEVVPQLQGTRAERVDDAAVVGWWALKEGVLWLPNPLAYSNCGASGHIAPLDLCPGGFAWQVGVSGVQVPGRTVSAAENAATSMYPGQTIDQILEFTARTAGLIGSEIEAVVTSSGDLRVSWLLRNSAVGVSFEVVTVTNECITGSLGWCYGTGWPATTLFAPDKPSALLAIDDVRAIIDSVAP